MNSKFQERISVFEIKSYCVYTSSVSNHIPGFSMAPFTAARTKTISI